MKVFSFLFAMFLTTFAAGADDGQILRKNVSATPDLESEQTMINMMKVYVDAQAANGDMVSIEYRDANGGMVETRDQAKPLLMFYTDGTVEHVSGVGFSGHGRRDMFSSISLDDGNTWKKTNLSQSADLSSIALGTGRNKVKYPGDVIQIAAAVAKDRVLAAWASRYCEGGSPAFAALDEDDDIFGVSGSQGYSDFADEGYPEVGLVPYACLWTARGVLEPQEDDAYRIVWRKPERVTSGRRDVNRVTVAGADDAGFIVTWQEDPDGLRPGQGLGPCEGWSGAIAHQQTDIWYSFVGWDDFGSILEEEVVNSAPGKGPPHPEQDSVPTVAVTMSIPVRLTDNGMCVTGVAPEDPRYSAYCYSDFDGDAVSDLCAESVYWTNPGGTTLPICKTEDGRVLWGRNAATLPVVNLRPYSKPDGTRSAWVILAYEETKALGVTAESDEIEPIDIGKTARYDSFDLFQPALVRQGLMLNAAARDPSTGELFEAIEDDWNNLYHETEIARHASLMTQAASKAADSRLVGFPLFKQGIINQGGPSDVMGRRFVLPEEGFDPTVDNPYAPGNMECAEWWYLDGSNPLYLNGLCIDPAINLSSTGIGDCNNGTSGSGCAAGFPWEGGETFPKVISWAQSEGNLTNESWTNPYDVACGHRGYLDGDFVMLIYAWSPNWKASTIGQDHYNLYARRSFDGAVSWTTTPPSIGGDGTCHVENYLDGSSVETCSGPGDFEQARNLSQLTGMHLTVLDPRYARTPESIVTEGAFIFPDDERDRSRYFAVYGTGDNTTTAEGDPKPLNLFYSRAYNFGDDYDYIQYFDQNGEVVEGWDWLEHSEIYHASKASVLANPTGNFFYAGWNQWQEDDDETVFDSDAWMRRIMYLDEVVTP